MKSLKIRAIREGDAPFIFNSWLRSYRESPAVVAVPNGIFYEQHHKVISRILESSYSQVLVACDAEDDDKLYGYVVGEFLPGVNIIHWVYCKQECRREGIGGQLVAEIMVGSELPVQYSHFTRFIKKINTKIHMTYNPYAAFGEL